MIFGLWGEDKSCKSTLAYSAPTPLDVFEFDIGGFDRAINPPAEVEAVLHLREKYEKGLIRKHPIITPVHGFDLSSTGEFSFRSIGMLHGYKEVWQKFIREFVTAITGDCKSINMDTGTIMWKLMGDVLLQEKQEKQIEVARLKGIPTDKVDLREQLMEIEYKPLNDMMRNIIYMAKSHGKNLIITHHSRDAYKDAVVDGKVLKMSTGKRERAGFKSLGDSTDMMVKTYIEVEQVDIGGGRKAPKRVPYCEICVESFPISLVGLKIKEPSYDKLSGMIEMLTGKMP